ncbi:MAG: hypothetical protein J6Y88_03290, partial [Bacteroidales bacterium]|nr:hypothetical protein [Bacteroidales bacterium]
MEAVTRSLAPAEESQSIESDPRIVSAVASGPDADELSGGTPASPTIGFIAPFGCSAETGRQPNFAQYGQDWVDTVNALTEVTGGSVMLYHTGNATIDNVARVLETCGLVLIHSHGVTDYYNADDDDETSRANCSYLCLTNYPGVTEVDMASAEGPYGRYYYAMIGCGYAEVSGTAISNHMQKDAPHSLVYTGMCSGMATDGFVAPLRARGVEAMWGYSQPVWCEGDRLYMLSVLGGVCEGMTFSEAVAAAKQEYGYWDPAFPDYTLAQAIADHTAFPIVVSSEDPYPGHDHV